MTDPSKLAILVGGGPAPGINSVIGAATIRACVEGIPVLGIRDGFSAIMRGDISKVRPLDIEAVSRIHFRGGSTLGTARANPTKDPALLDTTVSSLKQLGVTQLITIGGKYAFRMGEIRDNTVAGPWLDEARARLRRLDA